MPNLKELLAIHASRLEKAGVFTAAFEAKTIIGRILDIPEEAMEAEHGRPVTPGEERIIAEAVALREKRIPAARIFGMTTFYGLNLRTAPGVFASYPESEPLVSHALNAIADKQKPLRILDLGTGCGCLLLALLNELPNAAGLGIDVNEASIVLARENAEATGLAARTAFQTNDWDEGIKEQFDLIVSNPPCVQTRRIPRLLPEMREHDPRRALDGGEDGLKFYRRIAQNLPQLAKPDARAFIQIGPPISADVEKIFRSAGYSNVEIKANYRGLPSCIEITNRKKESAFKRLLRI